MSDAPERIESTSREAWLAARTQGIGGSDAPAVLGVSPWKSPLALYVEKLGLAEPEVETEAMQFGTILEPVVADVYQRRTGRELKDHGRFTIFRSRSTPVMQATLDREILGDARGPGVLQIKTASAFKAEEWEDEPPVMHLVQLMHEIDVMGYGWGSLAVLIGGQQFRYYDVEVNVRFTARLRVVEQEFWQRLAALDPPPPDATESSKDALARLYPKDSGATVALPDDAIEWDRALREAKEQLKALDAVIEGYEAKLKAALGEASFGELPGGGRYSWRAIERAGYTVQPSTIRILRRLRK